MPEIRYQTEMNYPPGIPADEKTAANAKANGWITYIPYEVSDEELAQEEEERQCEEYLGHSPGSIPQHEIWYLLRAFGKRLGYKVEQ